MSLTFPKEEIEKKLTKNINEYFVSERVIDFIKHLLSLIIARGIVLPHSNLRTDRSIFHKTEFRKISFYKTVSITYTNLYLTEITVQKYLA